MYELNVVLVVRLRNGIQNKIVCNEDNKGFIHEIRYSLKKTSNDPRGKSLGEILKTHFQHPKTLKNTFNIVQHPKTLENTFNIVQHPKTPKNTGNTLNIVEHPKTLETLSTPSNTLQHFKYLQHSFAHRSHSNSPKRPTLLGTLLSDGGGLYVAYYSKYTRGK